MKTAAAGLLAALSFMPAYASDTVDIGELKSAMNAHICRDIRVRQRDCIKECGLGRGFKIEPGFKAELERRSDCATTCRDDNETIDAWNKHARKCAKAQREEQHAQAKSGPTVDRFENIFGADADPSDDSEDSAAAEAAKAEQQRIERAEAEVRAANARARAQARAEIERSERQEQAAAKAEERRRKRRQQQAIDNMTGIIQGMGRPSSSGGGSSGTLLVDPGGAGSNCNGETCR